MNSEPQDAFTVYVRTYKLAEIDNLAQEVGYRVQINNQVQFDLEPPLGLPEFTRKTFATSDRGKLQAIAYLARVKGVLEILQSPDPVPVFIPERRLQRPQEDENW